MLFTDRENDEPELIQTSNYFDNANLSIEMSTKMYSFNCQSINAKIDELKIKIMQCKAINCQFSAICLQETWLSGNADTSLLQIDGHTLISRGKTCSAQGFEFIIHCYFVFKEVVGLRYAAHLGCAIHSLQWSTIFRIGRHSAGYN